MRVQRCCKSVLLYVNFGSNIRPRTFGCVAMDSAVLFILRSHIALIFRRVWSEESASCFVLDLVRYYYVFSRQKLYLGMVVCISWLNSCLYVWMC